MEQQSSTSKVTDALHIDLVEGDAAGSVEPGAARKQRRSTSASLDDGFQTQQVRGLDGSSETAKKQANATKSIIGAQRRHQIPGLRSTPYLKVLLVRCDDNDSYKATVRSEIREWIKEQTLPSSGPRKVSTQEKHDAFEWLIVHVVIPNTVAATQPRSSGSKADASAADKSSATSRWRPGSTPLLEKLRSDFNSSSKGAPDRVAQIRIGINDVPYDLLPRVVPAVPSGYSETAQDADNAWNDLMAKLKGLILTSFDMRVTQYEDDIKERDGQRSLPGWNFCTFFILKEGLARGFESVGLVEDALVGYDELSVGLDTVLHEQTESGLPERHGGAMLTHTEDVKRAVKKALAEAKGEAGDEEAEDLQKKETMTNQTEDIPVSFCKKAYREMILANKVSVFDFRCYIFSRQIALLLRLGNASASKDELLAKLKDQRDAILYGVAPSMPPMKNDDDGKAEKLDLLSEVCRRTLEFIPSISPILRRDISMSLSSGANAHGAKGAELDPPSLEMVDNYTASFAFSVAQQILAQTSTRALPIPPTTFKAGNGTEPKSSIPEPKTMMHPARVSSLHSQASTARPPQGQATLPSHDRWPGAAEMGSQSSSFLKGGLEELSARRAELYMLCRSILDKLGGKRAWSNGWDEAPLVNEADGQDMEEISLEEETSAVAKGRPTNAAPAFPASALGIESQILRAATDNAADFYRLYEILTDKALQHFTVAGHKHAVHACRADLAVLKVHLKDYDAAAEHFVKSTPFFGMNGWSRLELSLLVMYCQCLGKLKANDNYVRAALKLLSKSCSAERERRQRRSMPLTASARKPTITDMSSVRSVAQTLFSLTKELSSELKVTLANFFMNVELEGCPEYHDGQDSCSLSISLRSLLPEEITVDTVKLRVTCVDGGPCREVNFEAKGDVVIVPGQNVISVKTHSIVPGKYRASRLDLFSNKLVFHHEQDFCQPPPRTSDIFASPDVTLFQRTRGLDVQLTASKHISLGKNNALELVINPGWNALTRCDVRLRPTTGGLRLLTTEARVSDGSGASFAKPPEPGAMFLGPMRPDAPVTVRFPYSIEQDLGDVSVRVEAWYTNESNDSFHAAKSIVVPVSLAVGVNVQDVFKHDALFSRFNVETASSSPLRLLKSELQGSELFEPCFGPGANMAAMVFPKQQATLLYKITRKPGGDDAKAATTTTTTGRTGRTLHLKLYYSVLQTEIEDVIRQSVMQGLRDTPLEPYSTMTAALVLAETKRGLRAQDLERAALVGEMTTACLQGTPWAHLLRGLGRVPGAEDDAATQLAEFLERWQRKHARLRMPAWPAPDDACSIAIPVEMPCLPVLHTADIRIDDSVLHHLEGAEGGAPAAVVGQVLPATLHLKWTRRWDTGAGGGEDEEFSYEVTAPPDSWLLGGRRKGHFVIPGGKAGGGASSTAETEAEIPLVLVAQREGRLAYPTVDIREVRSTDGRGGPAAGAAACEVDWRNLGETVRVVSERRSVTVSLDASGPGGGPLVFESERLPRRQRGRIVL
ncbi:hypothetical protein UVI_02049440 [Ustilaginoidea virens]|uniref:TMEM1 family protein n=1 Tax=Ustilaginoidea virens TaxID=1159556 RepID=A0A1B5LAK9_USTVR|nr:hypothetical protein UVI_02049440 [Ustilaginoidea virens]